MTAKTKGLEAGPKSRRSAAAVPRTVAALSAQIPAPLAAMQQVDFETEDGSPFSDGYSISKEAAVLKPLLESDNPDETDPLYPRLVMYEDRVRLFRRMQEEYRLRDGAERHIKVDEAIGLRALGSLVDEEQDTMTLHTKEAFRLFMGRARDPSGAYAQIVGGRRVASALRQLYSLSGKNNPYADWALLLHEDSMRELAKQMDTEVKRLTQKLEAQKARGLSYSIVRSAEPKVNNLGFKSPYGYAISELVVQYDYFVRLVKTLVRKDQLTDDQGRQLIRELTRMIRREFIQTARFERFLTRPELVDLSRSDFLPSASSEAAKRVLGVTHLFGPIPADIFSARIQPRHSGRRVKIVAIEQALLDKVGAELQVADAEAVDMDQAAVGANEEAHLL